MFRASLLAEQRRHPRAQLHLPVRLRWPGPLASQLEICQSRDASRSGLLIYRREACEERSRVWVTFPFDSAAAEPQPETPARVVRTKATPSGGQLVALDLEPFARRAPPLLGRERRMSLRVPLAIPIWFRAAEAPWPEEAMTLDLSSAGVQFETSRLCDLGDEVRVQFDFGDRRSEGEIPARVVRVEPLIGAPEQRVAIAWHRPPKRLHGAETTDRDR